jgi:hypothetical protein
MLYISALVKMTDSGKVVRFGEHKRDKHTCMYLLMAHNDVEQESCMYVLHSIRFDWEGKILHEFAHLSMRAYIKMH